MRKRLVALYISFTFVLILLVLCVPEKYEVCLQKQNIDIDSVEWSQNNVLIRYDLLPVMDHYNDVEVTDIYHWEHRGWSEKKQVAQFMKFESVSAEIAKEYYCDTINVVWQELPASVEYKYKTDPYTNQSFIKNNTVVYYSVNITHAPYQTAEFGYDIYNAVYKFQKNGYMISGSFRHTITDPIYTEDEISDYLENYLTSVYPDLQLSN